jgi:hypothetical protein
MEPLSLVLRKQECFYCLEKEGARCCEIMNSFGIISCDRHYEASVRDCNAYMHREKMVSTIHAMYSDKTQPFFSILEKGFTVKRTSGVYENDWVVNTRYPSYILFDTEIDNWTIPVRNKSYTLYKRINISDFKNPSILKDLPSEFLEILNAVINILNLGFYKEDSDIHDLLIEREVPKTIEETPGEKIVFVDNKFVRILDP